MVLDYRNTCGYCSTALTSPPRDGTDSTCAYLHTRQGRRQFERIAKANRKRQVAIDRVSAPLTPVSTDPIADTNPPADTHSADTTADADTESDADTLADTEPGLTRAQQWRLDNPELYQAQKDRARDRRNGPST